MYKQHTVGVVVPAYNEEGIIGEVIRTMPDYVDRIYLVDDASTDDSLNEALRAAKEDFEADIPGNGPLDSYAMPDGGGGHGQLAERGRIARSVGRLVPIQHHENRGAGGAIKTGYLAALRDGMDLTVTMDGDGQMDPEYMTKVLDPIVSGEADYAKGNRLLYRDYRAAMPKFRFLGNAILTFLTKIASGYWKTMDPQNGYTAISQYALENVGIEDLYEYYGYCNDLLVRLNAKGMRVADVAIPAVYGEEESSISYPSYIKNVSGMLLRDFLWRLKTRYLVLDFHPLALFYLFGTATAGLGIVGGLWTVYSRIALGTPLFTRGMLSLVLLLLGTLLLMFAMLFDMQVNKDKEVQIRD